MHNQYQPNHDQYPQEIDLVDVASVVYRRKATLVLVVLCSVIVAFGYWFSLGEKIQVSAVYKIGEEVILDSGGTNLVPLMSASDSSQLLKLVYLPALLQSHRPETGTQINQENIDINYVDSGKGFEKNTTIIELFSEGSQQDAQALVPIFDSSLNLLLKNHTEKFNEYKSRVNSLIETQKSNLLLLKQLSTTENPNAGLSQTSLVEANIMSLESTLATATKSMIIKSASVEQTDSKGPVIYVAGGVVLGLFLGCFVVFFLELYAKAKIRAAETA
jgi:hypothetical protein